MSSTHREQAKELLKQIDDVLVDHDIFGWPWWPFRPASNDEIIDRRRVSVIRQLRDETNPAKQLTLTEELIKLGGYEIEDGILELSRGSFRFFDHFQRIEKLEELGDFCGVFDRYVKYWNGSKPDWIRIGEGLTQHQLVQSIDLPNISLAELRYCLPLLADTIEGRGVKDQVDPVQNGSPITETQQFEWRFDGSNWFVRFREEKGLFPDDDGMYYYARILASIGETKNPTGLDLCAERQGITPENLEEIYLSSDQEQTDRVAVANIKRELRELEDQLECATTASDAYRISEIEVKIVELTRQLTEGQGYRGHKRLLAQSGYKKMAENVRKALYRARDKIEKKSMIHLANHLKSAVRQSNGTFLYSPDEPINWHIERK